MPPQSVLREMTRDELETFVRDSAGHILEDEALAILANPHCTAEICSAIARDPRLAASSDVRVRLVAHRRTPQAHAVKLVHYLIWPDLLRLSVDVQVPAAARRAIDTQLLLRVDKLSLGERIASARRCGGALVPVFLFDPSVRVLEALLMNARLREDDVLLLASSPRASREKLQLIADHPKWSYRRAIRLALVLNRFTPPAAAASQLRNLEPADLRRLAGNPQLSRYLAVCIERMLT